MCAETVDCYSGQICQAGRCTFTSNIYGSSSNYLGGANFAYGTDNGIYHPYAGQNGFSRSNYNAFSTLMSKIFFQKKFFL